MPDSSAEDVLEGDVAGRCQRPIRRDAGSVGQFDTVLVLLGAFQQPGDEPVLLIRRHRLPALDEVWGDIVSVRAVAGRLSPLVVAARRALGAASAFAEQDAAAAVAALAAAVQARLG